MPIGGGQSDIAFGFDPTPFMNGMKDIQKGMGNLTNTAQKTASSIGKQMFSALAKIEILKAGFRAVSKVVRKLAAQMPEVGKAFDIAGEVLSKNLLWPLRQEVAPLLQNMLDWVRDNRAQFAAFGQVLASAFRMAIQLAGQVWEVLKNVAESIRPALENVFGDLFGSLDETVNMLLLKVSVMAQFITRMLEPMGEIFVQMVEDWLPRLQRLFEGVVELAMGFWEGIEGIGESFQNIVGHLGDFVDNMTTATEKGNTLQSALNTLGETAGNVVSGIAELADVFLEEFVGATEGLMDPVNSIADAFERISDVLFGEGAIAQGIRDLTAALGESVGSGLMWAAETAADAMERLADELERIDRLMEQGVGFGEAALQAGGGPTVEESGGPLRWFGQHVWEGIKTPFTREGWTGERDVDDAIIHTDGSITRTNPNDTLIATQSPVAALEPQAGPMPQTGGSGRSAGSQQNWNVTLNVTEGNARQAGERFAQGMRMNVLDSLSAEGY